MKIIYGKKTVLIPFDPETDMQHFLSLLDEHHELMGSGFFKSKDAYLSWVLSELITGRWVVWSCWPKSGSLDATKRFGFIALFDINPVSTSIQGLMDKSVMRGLLKLLQNNKTLTLTEDCLRTVVQHAMSELHVHKLDATCVDSNVTSRRLLEKCGFVHEGKLREGSFNNGQFEAMHLFGLLSSDIQPEKAHVIQEEDQHRGIDRSLQPSSIL